jgi:hypothetical protein
MRTRHAMYPVLATLLCHGCGTTAAPRITRYPVLSTLIAKEQADPAVSATLQAQLAERMSLRRARLLELRWSAPSLDFDRTGDLALRLADEDGDHVGGKLPEDFVVREAELKRRARSLAFAARLGDSRAVRVAYRSMVGSCSDCHARFQVRVEAARLDWASIVDPPAAELTAAAPITAQTF